MKVFKVMIRNPAAWTAVLDTLFLVIHLHGSAAALFMWIGVNQRAKKFWKQLFMDNHQAFFLASGLD